MMMNFKDLGWEYPVFLMPTNFQAYVPGTLFFKVTGKYVIRYSKTGQGISQKDAGWREHSALRDYQNGHLRRIEESEAVLIF